MSRAADAVERFWLDIAADLNLDDAKAHAGSRFTKKRVHLEGSVDGFRTTIGIQIGDNDQNGHAFVHVYVRGLPTGLQVMPFHESHARAARTPIVVNCRDGRDWSVWSPITTGVVTGTFVAGRHFDLASYLDATRRKAICSLTTGLVPAGDEGHRLSDVLDDDPELREWSRLNRTIRKAATGDMDAQRTALDRNTMLVTTARALVRDAKTAMNHLTIDTRTP